MNITKTTQSLKATREELEQINSMTRRELEEENLYLFSVRLCDNEVDRDGERFTTETLQELAPMFVGKSGIFDHQWSAHGQSARLYKCEVVTEPARLNQAGEVYCWLKGYAYMLRSPGSEQLIAEIDASSKKHIYQIICKLNSVCIPNFCKVLYVSKGDKFRQTDVTYISLSCRHHSIDCCFSERNTVQQIQ